MDSKQKRVSKTKSTKSDMINSLLAQTMASINVKKEPVSDSDFSSNLDKGKLNNSKDKLNKSSASLANQGESKVSKKQKRKLGSDNLEFTNLDRFKKHKREDEHNSLSKSNMHKKDSLTSSRDSTITSPCIKQEIPFSSDSISQERESLERLFSKPSSSSSSHSNAKLSKSPPKQKTKSTYSFGADGSVSSKEDSDYGSENVKKLVSLKEQERRIEKNAPHVTVTPLESTAQRTETDSQHSTSGFESETRQSPSKKTKKKELQTLQSVNKSAPRPGNKLSTSDLRQSDVNLQNVAKIKPKSPISARRTNNLLISKEVISTSDSSSDDAETTTSGANKNQSNLERTIEHVVRSHQEPITVANQAEDTDSSSSEGLIPKPIKIKSEKEGNASFTKKPVVPSPSKSKVAHEKVGVPKPIETVAEVSKKNPGYVSLKGKERHLEQRRKMVTSKAEDSDSESSSGDEATLPRPAKSKQEQHLLRERRNSTEEESSSIRKSSSSGKMESSSDEDITVPLPIKLKQERSNQHRARNSQSSSEEELKDSPVSKSSKLSKIDSSSDDNTTIAKPIKLKKEHLIRHRSREPQSSLEKKNPPIAKLLKNSRVGSSSDNDIALPRPIKLKKEQHRPREPQSSSEEEDVLLPKPLKREHSQAEIESDEERDLHRIKAKQKPAASKSESASSEEARMPKPLKLAKNVVKSESSGSDSSSSSKKQTGKKMVTSRTSKTLNKTSVPKTVQRPRSDSSSEDEQKSKSETNSNSYKTSVPKPIKKPRSDSSSEDEQKSKTESSSNSNDEAVASRRKSRQPDSDTSDEHTIKENRTAIRRRDSSGSDSAGAVLEYSTPKTKKEKKDSSWENGKKLHKSPSCPNKSPPHLQSSDGKTSKRPNSLGQTLESESSSGSESDKVLAPKPLVAPKTAKDKSKLGEVGNARRSVNEKSSAERREMSFNKVITSTPLEEASSGSDAEMPRPKKIKLDASGSINSDHDSWAPRTSFKEMSWLEKLKHRIPAIEKQANTKVDLPSETDVKYSLLLVPKTIEPRSLLGLKCRFKKEKAVRINDKEYVFEALPRKPDPVLVNVHGPKLIEPEKTFCLRVCLPKLTLINPVVPKRENISLPDEMKTRHPLFGFNYKKKLRLDEEVVRKLHEAVVIKTKAERKEIRKKRKSKKKLWPLEVEENVMNVFNAIDTSNADILQNSEAGSWTHSKKDRKGHLEKPTTPQQIDELLVSDKKKHKMSKKGKSSNSDDLELMSGPGENSKKKSNKYSDC